ncbi:MAG: nitrilase family protein [Bacteroidia bacterium]|nr:nitrilase family protein [Bacteroidia bacterium]
MRISLIQSDIIWEHKSANLLYFESLLSGLTEKTDLAVLPEMCTTGFSMNPEQLAETMEGETITAFKRMAANFGFAIAGTFIGKEASNCYNRAFFIQPDGQVDFYDKKHLFRMGDEGNHYASGKVKKIVSYLGWNIRLAVCYELRFPVWLRNVKNEYDLLLVMANWPESRQHVWTSLLTARALENQAYVCGVNRVGTDANGIVYTGGSMLVNAYGTTLTDFEQESVGTKTTNLGVFIGTGTTAIQTLDLNLEELHRFRRKFPVWKDADAFEFL